MAMNGFEAPRQCATCADVIRHPAVFYSLYRGPRDVTTICSPCVDDGWLDPDSYAVANENLRTLYSIETLAFVAGRATQQMASLASLGEAMAAAISDMAAAISDMAAAIDNADNSLRTSQHQTTRPGPSPDGQEALAAP